MKTTTDFIFPDAFKTEAEEYISYKRSLGFSFSIDLLFHKVVVKSFSSTVQAVCQCQGMFRIESPFKGCSGFYGPVLI